MRKLLFWCLVILALAATAIGVFALLYEGREEVILLVLLPIALFIPLLFVYLIITTFTAQKSRHLGMGDAARQLGFSYSETVTPSLRSAVAGFELIEKDTALSDEISGEHDGVAVRVFMYRRSDTSGDRPRYYDYTVAILPGELKSVPDFTLIPETMWERLRQVVVGEDINFQGSQNSDAFSRNYSLRSNDGSDEPEVRRFFDKELIVFFAHRKGIYLQVVGESLMAWYRPSFGMDLARACKSMQANFATDANKVVNQALEILKAFKERKNRT